MSVLLVVLTWLHVFSAVAWLGSYTYLLAVIFPGLARMEGASRREFLLKLLPRHARYTIGSATATIVFGLALYALMHSEGGVSSTWETYLMAGILSAVLAYVLVLAAALGMARATRTQETSRFERLPAGMLVGLIVGFVALVASFTFMVLAATQG